MIRPRDYQDAAINAAFNWIRYRPGVGGYVTAPGGSGKSVMIALLAERVLKELGRRVVIIARNEKLLRQNRSKFSHEVQADIGFYCDGLGEKCLDRKITIASAQSVYKQGDHFKGAVVLADEAHNISNDSDDETQYWTFLKDAEGCQLVGFTATPMRTGSGKLTWGEEIIKIPLPPLFEKGHLVRPTNKVGATPDLSRVDVLLNEYVQNQLEDVYTDPKLLDISVEKIRRYSDARNSVIIFGQSLKHIALLAEAMELNGMPCVAVDGKTDKQELARILDDFEKRRFKFLLNCTLLKEGVDCPCIDMVVVLRSTVSKTLWEQMIYRGTRPYPGKTDFLLLDMGGNLQAHGPLGSPYREKSKQEAKRPVGRICPECESFVESGSTDECPDCGYRFPDAAPQKVSHNASPDHHSRVVYEGHIETYKVRAVQYAEHLNRKKGSISLRVDYYCDSKYGKISEWLVPHHESEWVRGKAHKFFKERGWNAYGGIEKYDMETLLWHAANLKKPVEIVVDHGEEFPRIKQYIFAADDEAAPVLTNASSAIAPGGLDDILEGDIIPF